MRYRVIVTPQADGDLRRAVSYIRRDNPRAARAWLKGARQRIKTLAQHPERCPLAPETATFTEPIRELLYGHGNRGTDRILYVLLESTIFVLHMFAGHEVGRAMK